MIQFKFQLLSISKYHSFFKNLNLSFSLNSLLFSTYLVCVNTSYISITTMDFWFIIYFINFINVYTWVPTVMSISADLFVRKKGSCFLLNKLSSYSIIVFLLKKFVLISVSTSISLPKEAMTYPNLVVLSFRNIGIHCWIFIFMNFFSLLCFK